MCTFNVLSTASHKRISMYCESCAKLIAVSCQKMEFAVLFLHSFSWLYLWSNVVNSEWGHRGPFRIQPTRPYLACSIRFGTKLYRKVALQEQNWTPLAYMIFDLLPHDWSSSQALLSSCFISLTVYLSILFSFPSLSLSAFQEAAEVQICCVNSSAKAWPAYVSCLLVEKTVGPQSGSVVYGGFVDKASFYWTSCSTEGGHLSPITCNSVWHLFISVKKRNALLSYKSITFWPGLRTWQQWLAMAICHSSMLSLVVLSICRLPAAQHQCQADQWSGVEMITTILSRHRLPFATLHSRCKHTHWTEWHAEESGVPIFKFETMWVRYKQFNVFRITWKLQAHEFSQGWS